MGITGLIQFLEKASSKTSLRKFRGQCLAIDSYCLLHKGAFACADKLARGESTDVHIQYCLKYVNLLLSNDIKPILVFDGRHLPAKAQTEAKRRETRNNSKARAAELLRLGKVEEANSFLRRCVDITHEMALQLIQECRKRNVDCVVAPYEADAQLAYLSKIGIAQVVVTEDSDLMLFGCNKVLFKLDLTGNGLLIESDKLHLAMGCSKEKYTFDKFRYMCILSGCDYLPSLPGIGLAKARKFILTTEDPDIKRALGKIPAYLNMRQLEITDEYRLEFLKADATFKHMVVYDPVQRKQTRLNPLEDYGTDPELCANSGTFIDEETALQLALGNINPFTLKQLDNWHPDEYVPAGAKTSGWQQDSISKHASIWKGVYKSIPAEEVVVVRKEQTIRTMLKSIDVTSYESPNPAFEQMGQSESIDDVLEAYGIKTTPEAHPPKRLRLSTSSRTTRRSIEIEEEQSLNDLASLEEAAKSKARYNPFLVTNSAGSTSTTNRWSSESAGSPITITPENRSLLRNVSPVKRNEFDSKPVLQICSKTEKLSRFKRTVLANDGQKVISRFFSASSSFSSTASIQTITPPRTEPRSDPDQPPENDPLKEVTSIYLLSPEAKLKNRGEETPKKQKLHADCENLCSPLPPTKGEQSVEKVDSGFVDEPVEGFSSSQKENEDAQIVKSSRVQLFSVNARSETDNVQQQLSEIKGPLEQAGDDEIEIISEEESPGDNVQKRLSDSQSKKVLGPGRGGSQKKAACRRLGLAKVKSTAKEVGPTQSKLSMFGFQKKVQLK